MRIILEMIEMYQRSHTHLVGKFKGRIPPGKALDEINALKSVLDTLGMFTNKKNKMKTRTWQFGTRINGVVQEVIESKDALCPRMTLVLGDGEGFVIMGVTHEVMPMKRQPATIEFTKGGPTGGYWRIVKPEEKPA